MLLMVLAAILSFIFLSEALGIWGLVLLEIIITTAIILLAIKFIRPTKP